MIDSPVRAPGRLALLPMIAIVTMGTARAAPTPDDRSRPIPSGWPACERALHDTLESGKPTVLVLGARNRPEALAFLQGLCDALPGQPLARSLHWVELDAETDAETVRRTGVTQIPALLVYRRGARGLEVAGHRAGLTDPFFALGWLDTLGLAPTPPSPASASASSSASASASSSGSASGALSATTAPAPASAPAPAPAPAPAADPAASLGASGEPATLDESVAAARFSAGPSAQASPQAPCPPPKAPAVPPPQAPYAPPPSQPVYAAPVAPQPVYVQAPSSPIVFQQPQQQIVLAPPPPPQITVAMPAATAPSITYAVPPAAAAPPPSNLFLAPQPAAPVAMAAPTVQPVQPVQMAPAAPPAVAVAAAPVAQSPIAPTAALLLLNPNLIDRILGTLGEHLAQRKQPRVALAPQQPLLAPMMAMAPAAAPVAMAPVSAVAPMAYPAMVPAYPPAAPVYSAEPPPMASPQTPSKIKKHGWFHH